MKHRWLVLALSAGMSGMLLASGEPRETDVTPQWEAGAFFSYLTGDYGQDEKTEIYYAALTIRRYLGWGDVTLTVPYLDIPSDGVTFVGGAVEPVADGGTGAGLGDIILKGRYYAVEQDGLLPFIDLVGSVKFPTADADKGLGTGEPDFTVLGEFTWRLGDSAWFVLAELGYTLVGEPAGFDVRNRWLYSVGLAYELDDRTTISGYLDGRTAIFEGNDNPLSVLVIGQYKFRPDLRLDALVELGLNDGSPDFGVTLGLRQRF